MGHDDRLFSRVSWSDLSAAQRKRLGEEIDGIESNRLLNTSVDDLREYFVKKYWIEVPTIRKEQVTVEQRAILIPVGREYTESGHAEGIQITVSVPFVGDAAAFEIRPTRYSFDVPEADVKRDHFTFFVSGCDLKADEVKRNINRSLDTIEQNLETLRNDVENFNSRIDAIAGECIESRRSRLLANQNLVASLGFHIRERNDSVRTFAAPQVRRKIVPTLPQASSAPYKPEPMLPESEYEHILTVIDNMAQVMERSPSAFTAMDEEALRTHFLVQLNGHYEGQATGETFNYNGKTDVLIRVDGKNIFIAECKYWGGAAKLTDTIDQLLGYSSWRDTKVSVIIFNRNKDFTRVLETIRATTKEHPHFKRELGNRSETSFRYVFSHRDDANRELLLTVMAFDVPK